MTGPGVTLAISAASIDDSGVAAVDFRVTDAEGVPLDVAGRLTQGAVTVRVVLAALEETESGAAAQYVSYTTRVQTSPITGQSATQAAVDVGGTMEPIDVRDGTYRYTFAASAAGFDPAATHTIAANASRTVDGVAYRAQARYDFLPGGGTPSLHREVVSDNACQGCHGSLSGHGGQWKSTSDCILCHTGQTSDPDTGNTVDFRVMIHKIHRGSALPSVVNGTPYQIIGFNQSVNDWSTVTYPQDLKRCVSCHAGAQGDVWKTRPGVAGCTSCHDDVSFVDPPPAGMRLHSGGVQDSDAPCQICHTEGAFNNIPADHLGASFDPASTQVALTILGVASSGPGQAPVVTFGVEVDGAPRDILTAPLTRITATIAGPNSDFASYWQATAQGSGAAGTLTAVDAPAGIFQWAMPASAAMPTTAAGSYTLGFEAYLQATGGPRFAAFSPTFAFAVTDSTAVARRKVIDAARCNGCHFDLSFHGGGRKNAEYCLMCHNPNNANDERAPHLEGADVLVESVDFRVMIHKIHAGEHLTQPYILGANPAPTASNPMGTPVDFGETRYPRALTDCSACHTGQSWQLPLASDLLPSTLQERTCVEDPAADSDSYCNAPFFVLAQTIALQPTAAVCTSCHDQPYVAAHAEVMTTSSGAESCATCHGPGSALDVAVVHGGL